MPKSSRKHNSKAKHSIPPGYDPNYSPQSAMDPRYSPRTSSLPKTLPKSAPKPPSPKQSAHMSLAIIATIVFGLIAIAFTGPGKRVIRKAFRAAETELRK